MHFDRFREFYHCFRKPDIGFEFKNYVFIRFKIQTFLRFIFTKNSLDQRIHSMNFFNQKKNIS